MSPDPSSTAPPGQRSHSKSSSMRLAGRDDAAGTIRPTKAGYTPLAGPTRSEPQAAGRAGAATRVVADQPLWLDTGTSDPSQPDDRQRPGDPRRRPDRASAAAAETRVDRATPRRRRHRRTRVAPDRQRPKRPLSR